jgi:hypothetical protein
MHYYNTLPSSYRHRLEEKNANSLDLHYKHAWNLRNNWLEESSG